MKSVIVITALLSFSVSLYAAEVPSDSQSSALQADQLQELLKEIKELKESIAQEKDVYSCYSISERIEELEKGAQAIKSN